MNEREEHFCEKLIECGWATPDEKNELQNDNSRLRLLIDDAIRYMSHAELFLTSRERMHPIGIEQLWELIDRMRKELDGVEMLGNESALLVGGE